MKRAIAVLACAGLLVLTGKGNDDLNAEAKRIAARSDVKRAFDYIDSHRDEILAEWKTITEINAPSGKEQERAGFIRRLLEGYKLDRVYTDAKGNLIAVRKGTGGAKPVVFDAHLDTVFQEGLKIKAEIRDGKIFAPGIGDDTRNIEALLATIRALNHAGVRTRADLIFVFTVEEETSFGGVKHFVEENKDNIGQYVALDGGYEGLTYGGIGINWYRVHFIGPGGHTRSKTPPYSASLPAARAIARIYALELPDGASVNLNIGMMGGSEVVNAKAADAWFTVDVRSTDQKLIDEYERRIYRIAREEAEREGMQSRVDVIGEKTPAAQIPGNRGSFTVRMAEAVHRAMGFDNVPVTNTASNNANVAMLAGLPAISTGAGPCGDAHALTEWCYIEPFYRGVKKTILLAVALAGT
ncbi:MAG TPA: M20/M25/M40 family metallo-hydrolase [Blastocatellia bacterium]|jgi:acetylornithine deacetylase/succinyl-diaminopimelate desuccinylase-like protein